MRFMIATSAALLAILGGVVVNAQPKKDCRIDRTCPKPAPKPQRSEVKPAAPKSRAPGHLSQVWLKGGLYGADNEFAALMKVSITPVRMSSFARPSGALYQVTIENQFNMTCDLFANSSGDPGKLENCQSPINPNTGLPEGSSKDIIYLKCNKYKKEVVCSSIYNLQLVSINSITGEKYISSSAWEIKIARRL